LAWWTLGFNLLIYQRRRVGGYGDALLAVIKKRSGK
jgi:hypothetical protein